MGLTEDAFPPAHLPGTARRLTLADGLSLHVRDAGEGPPLLLLHGFTGSAEAWGAPLLHGLAERHRVIAPDLPGHGRSDVLPGGPQGALPRLLDALGEALDVLDAPSATWIGYSMGGRIALAAAVLRPGRTERLVLEGGSPGLPTEREREERRREDEALAARILEEGMERFVDAWMAHPLFASQRRLPAPRLEEARRRRLRSRPKGLAWALRALGTGALPSFWEALPRLSRRTLLLVGEEDARYAALAREMAGRLPDARVRSVPRAGHAVHFERPDAWLEAVRSFLDARDTTTDARETTTDSPAKTEEAP